MRLYALKVWRRVRSIRKIRKTRKRYIYSLTYAYTLLFSDGIFLYCMEVKPKHAGGRPRMYKDAQELDDAIDTYFDGGYEKEVRYTND